MADTLILAGDITTAKPYLLDLVFKSVGPRWKDVIFLPGNHEFYGIGIKSGWASINKATKGHPNIHVLNNAKLELNGTKIYGGTGWYDAPENEELKKRISDYHLIKDIDLVYNSWKDFQSGVAGYNPDLVITHHLPDYRCVATQYQGDPLNCFFVSDFNVVDIRAKMWVFGHTHQPMDFMLGSTRMVCNAFGYPTETKKDFKDELVLEV